MDWTASRTFCRDKKAHLVSFHSDDEWEFVKDKVVNKFLHIDVWTGGYKSSTWKWEDNTPLKEDDWVIKWDDPIRSGNENGCMQMLWNKSYKLAGLNCNGGPLPFVCKMNMGG